MFAKIWAKREKLREVGESSTPTLFIVARNLIFDGLLCKKFQIMPYDSFSLLKYLPCCLDPAANVEFKDTEKIIKLGVTNLPKQQQPHLSKPVVWAHSRRNCMKMGISRQSAKSHIVRALATLKKELAARTAQIFFLVYPVFNNFFISLLLVY